MVNQLRFARENFFDSQVVENVMINVMDKFKGKINAIEESCNMCTLSLINKQVTSIRTIECNKAT